MSAFDWVAQLWDALTCAVPRVGLVRKTHGAVRFGPRGSVRVLRPGVYWWMPLVHQVASVKVARRTDNLATQVVTTRDRVAVAASLVVVSRVEDVQKALVDTDDVSETVVDVGLKALAEEVAARTLDELLEAMRDGKLENALSVKTRRHLKTFGVHVENAFVSELTTRFHRMIGDGLTVGGEKG